MYQNDIITPQIKDKSYLQGFIVILLYIAKIKKLYANNQPHATKHTSTQCNRVRVTRTT